MCAPALHLGDFLCGCVTHQAIITIVTPVDYATSGWYRNVTRVGGPMTVSVLYDAKLKALDQSGDNCNDTTSLTVGSWGDAVCSLSVTTRSWRQLRVSWQRPRTVVGFFFPNYSIEVSTAPTFATVLTRVNVSSSVDPTALTLDTTQFPTLYYDVPGVSVGVQYYVRVYVSQPSAAPWGAPIGYSLSRMDCDCTPDADACPAESPAMLTPTVPVLPVITSVSTPSVEFSTRGACVLTGC